MPGFSVLGDSSIYFLDEPSNTTLTSPERIDAPYLGAYRNKIVRKAVNLRIESDLQPVCAMERHSLRG